MAALKYTFEQWWSINGRPEWDSTMARASWNAAIESAEVLKPSHNKQSTPCCDVCGSPLNGDMECTARLSHINE